jgi:hypothetical protein
MQRIDIRFDGKEYRVTGPNGTEAQAYYTDDRNDALDTCRHIFGTSVKTRVRRVEVLAP